MYSRIDLFLVDTILLQNVSDSKFHDIKWSDHAPISMTVKGKAIENRANPWHNDVHLLSIPENKVKVHNHIQDFFYHKQAFCVGPLCLVKLPQGLYEGCPAPDEFGGKKVQDTEA